MLAGCRLVDECRLVALLTIYHDILIRLQRRHSIYTAETIYIGRSKDFGSSDKTINNTQAG